MVKGKGSERENEREARAIWKKMWLGNTLVKCEEKGIVGNAPPLPGSRFGLIERPEAFVSFHRTSLRFPWRPWSLFWPMSDRREEGVLGDMFLHCDF